MNQALTSPLLPYCEGFLGQAVCKRAALDGYQVTSLSRRGQPPKGDSSPSTQNIRYLAGDAREKSTIEDILKEGSYAGMFLVFVCFSFQSSTSTDVSFMQTF